MTRLPRSIPMIPVLTNLVRARDRDRARPERLAEIQSALLTRLVRHAAATVPHYREAYEGLDADAVHDPQDLVKLPTVDRATVGRLGPQRFLSAGFTVDNTRVAGTSGSTGQPASFCYSERDLGYLRATFLWDMLASGMSPADRVGYFRVSGFRRHRLEKLGLARNVHIDTSRTVAEQADAFLAGRPTFLYGFPSAMAAVVRELQRRRVRYERAKTVLFAGEPTLESGSAEVLDYFGATGHEAYACVEAYTIARTCRRGRMHLRSGDVVVEVEHDDGSVSVADGIGEILVTRLHAEAMPLIRYRLGDRVEIVPNDCDCGTAYTPIVRSVLGRVEDRIETRDGTVRNGDFLASYLLPLGRDGGLLRFQMVQRRPGAVTIVAVAAPGSQAVVEKRIRAAVEPASGEFEMDVEMVDAIAPERNGKIRLVKRM